MKTPAHANADWIQDLNPLVGLEPVREHCEVEFSGDALELGENRPMSRTGAGAPVEHHVRVLYALDSSDGRAGQRFHWVRGG